MEIIIGILVGLILLTTIVVIHELGHAIAARRNGVIVEEFGVGFPPRAVGKKFKNSFLGKNVFFSLNWLPLGGFVKMHGENDADRRPGTFGRATFWQKTKILLAGVLMNWLTAVVLLSGLSLFGVPKVIDDQFTIKSDSIVQKSPIELALVQEGSPAAKSGLQTGDRLISFDGKAIDSTDQLYALTKQQAGKSVEVVTKRGDEKNTRTTIVTLRAEKDAKEGYFGAAPQQRETLRATWSAPIVGVGLTSQLTVMTFQGLGDTLGDFGQGLVQKISFDEKVRNEGGQNIEAAGKNVAGPVGLLGKILPGVVQSGLPFVILVMAIISISLAALNVLPIPALDGGRWFVMAFFRLIKKPLTAKIEERIHGTGFLLLMGLFVLITIADIGKF